MPALNDSSTKEQISSKIVNLINIFKQNDSIDIASVKDLLHSEKYIRLSIGFDGPPDHHPKSLFEWLFLDLEGNKENFQVSHLVDYCMLLSYEEEYRNLISNDYIIHDIYATSLNDFVVAEIGSPRAEQSLLMFFEANIGYLEDETFKIIAFSAKDRTNGPVLKPEADTREDDNEESDDDYWNAYGQSETEEPQAEPEKEPMNIKESDYFDSYDQKQVQMDAMDSISKKMYELYLEAKQAGLSSEDFLGIAATVAEG